ncbi:hypothetical protein BDZ91DRAFT_674745 [Kalaharituber pfeilii]|nr:hypothetical protein BDZ91DRAFT_674745 [Kalaharituber pfeilii]
MAPPGVSAPLRFLKEAIQKGVAQLRAGMETTLSRQSTNLQPFYASAKSSHSARPADRIKVAKRWYTTQYRNLLRHAAINPNPPAEAVGRVSSAVRNLIATSPFATTLRPKLGAGAFPRTASGYSLGNGGPAGVRFFSHGPASPAQVISQVTQAMRAMALSGKNAADEYRRYQNQGRAGVRTHLAAALSDNSSAPGAYVDFHMAPTFTCLSGLSKKSMAAPGFMDVLSTDFSKIVEDVTAVMTDLQRLATLGDLPISLAQDKEDTIRVHFAGCDRELVEHLCDEVGVKRGVIGEDERFGCEFLMPTLDAPSYLNFSDKSCTSGSHPQSPPSRRLNGVALYWQDMISSPSQSTCSSIDGDESTHEGSGATAPVSVRGYLFGSSVEGSGWSPRGTSSSAASRGVAMASPPPPPPPAAAPGQYPLEELLGMEGIQRFLEQCEEYSNRGRNIWA